MTGIQLAPAVAPAILRAEHDGVVHLAIAQQLNGDALRSLILVPLVVPRLDDAELVPRRVDRYGFNGELHVGLHVVDPDIVLRVQRGQQDQERHRIVIIPVQRQTFAQHQVQTGLKAGEACDAVRVGNLGRSGYERVALHIALQRGGQLAPCVVVFAANHHIELRKCLRRGQFTALRHRRHAIQRKRHAAQRGFAGLAGQRQAGFLLNGNAARRVGTRGRQHEYQRDQQRGQAFRKRHSCHLCVSCACASSAAAAPAIAAIAVWKRWVRP